MRRPAVTVAVVILVLGTTLLALLIPYTRVDNCTAIEHNALDNNSSVASSYFAADYQSAREKVVSAGKGSGALLEHIQHPLFRGRMGGPCIPMPFYSVILKQIEFLYLFPELTVSRALLDLQYRSVYWNRVIRMNSLRVRIPAHREHPFWSNVNTYSGRT